MGRQGPSSGSRECSACNVGYFANETGLLACLKCFPGTFLDSKAGEALAFLWFLCCKQFQSSFLPNFSWCCAGTSCDPCEVGTYREEEGQSSCRGCPVGRANNRTGSQGCDLCPRGKHQDAEKQVGCKECPMGKASATEGFAECLQCQPGKYSNITGQEACEPCPTGYFQDGYGTFSLLAGLFGCLSFFSFWFCNHVFLVFFQGLTAANRARRDTTIPIIQTGTTNVILVQQGPSPTPPGIQFARIARAGQSPMFQEAALARNAKPENSILLLANLLANLAPRDSFPSKRAASIATSVQRESIRF